MEGLVKEEKTVSQGHQIQFEASDQIWDNLTTKIIRALMNDKILEAATSLYQ